MNEETIIDISAAHVEGEKYDRCAKSIWRHKEILAPVLQLTIPEYQGCSIEDVIRFIDADSISEEDSISDIPSKVLEMNTEMTSLTEKIIRYDIRFRAKNPVLSNEDLLVMMHIDFEIQNDYKPSGPAYPVVKRAIYYGAREISSQLGTLTKTTDYNDLQKVYSIWVCNDNIPVALQNTVTRYSIQRENVIGENKEPIDDYDLMTVVIVRRGSDNANEDTIFDYLNGVFTGDVHKVDQYTDMANPEIREEVSKMSGMGASIYEKGYNQGVNQGISQGVDQGMTQLAQAIQELHAGASREELLKKFDQKTVDLAFACR